MADRYLVKEGEARSVIVRQSPEGLNAPLDDAIEELQRAIRRATGSILDVVTVHDLSHVPDEIVRISVGPNPMTRSLGIEPDALSSESFRVVAEGNNLVFVGSSQTPDATLWAVVYFLDRYLGVRWLWPGDTGTHVPGQRSIPLPEIDVTTRPGLEKRSLRLSALAPKEGTRWLRMHQMGSRSQYAFGHAFTHWRKEYGGQHPEYFAVPPTGKRQGRGDRVKLCVSNVDVDSVIIQEWQTAGTPDNWNVSPNDGTGFCTCDACRAMDTPSGQSVDAIWMGQAQLTTRYVRFWNRLLAKMRAINPKVTLSAYAYSAYREPPPEIQLNDGLVLGFVHAYWAQEKWKAWSDAGAKLLLRPNWWYSGGIAPHMPLHMQGAFFQFAMKHGMIGLDFDSLHGHWGTQGPLYYLIARLAERSDLSVNDVIAEYASAFGSAAPVIVRYIDFWEQFSEEAAFPAAAGGVVSQDRQGRYEALANEHALPLHPIAGSYPILPFLYTDEVLSEARLILEQAEQAAEADDEYVHARIAFLRDALRHVELTREVVRIGYEGARPTGATRESFVRLREELDGFRREISSRHIVWQPVLAAYERRRKIPTHESRLVNLDDERVSIEQNPQNFG